MRVDRGRRFCRCPHICVPQPPPSSVAGVVNLYSSDFYALAGARLQEGGLLAQWWPLPTQNDEDSRSLVRSFLDVFPHASLWTTEFHEMLLIGSFQPIELDVPRITERYAEGAPSGDRRPTTHRVCDLGALEGVRTCPAPVACASHHAAPEWRLWGLTLLDCVPPLWNRATPWPPGGRRCQSPR